MRPSENTDLLESRIHYRFRTPALLTEAMTHPSLRQEYRGRSNDNQRLEFLGDSVLQLVLSEKLFELLPAADEGVLTKLRNRLVSEPALAKMARDLGLGAFIHLGRSIVSTGGRDRNSTLSDALEALMGAIYLDGGLESARAFILRVTEADLKLVLEKPMEMNPKGELQELLQGQLGSPPSYRTVHEEGPGHERTFCVAVAWKECDLGQGKGGSKKEAEIDAARAALAGNALRKLLAGVAHA